MFTILRKEINAFLNSLIGYMVMIVFLTGVGLFFWVFPQTSVLEYGYASLETLFSITPFIYLFLIPAITMRTFAEEKQAGTIELLLTRPLTTLQIVLSKYFASLVLVFIALLPTFTYYYTVYQLASPVGNIDSAAVAGSYIGLLLLGAGLISPLVEPAEAEELDETDELDITDDLDSLELFDPELIESFNEVFEQFEGLDDLLSEEIINSIVDDIDPNDLDMSDVVAAESIVIEMCVQLRYSCNC